MLIVSYIREYLLAAADEYFGDAVVMHIIGQLLALAQGKDIPLEPDGSLGEGLGSLFSVRHFRSFEAMGLLEIRDSQPVIPELLRPVVALGAMLTLADLELDQA